MHELACLGVQVAGLELRNPTMLASGILGLTSNTLREVAKAGAGAVVTKSIGLEEREGYNNPTTVQVECGLINAMGLPNPGIREFKQEIEEARDLGVPLIVSVYGFSPEEYAKVASIAVEAGADAVELNLSCPHVEGTGIEMGQDSTIVTSVVSEVRKAVRKPLLAKLTPNVSNIVDLAVAAVDGGADALTAINTVRAMKIDIETTLPILSNKIGGLSGAAIKPIAVGCVYEIHKAVKVPIIGCGGISTWQDAVEFMLAGASAVQIGTSIAYKDLDIFRQVTEGILAYLKRKGHKSVEDIVGLSH
jgi:dihydroorotate dehydrogenase (NAD+) catalytic subunit